MKHPHFCRDCKKRIKGNLCPVYTKNGILKQEYHCYRCWVRNGRHNPINIAKLLKEV